ncbi:hypothetical protein ACQUJO_23965 [Ralstonia pseudosolanacearum]
MLARVAIGSTVSQGLESAMGLQHSFSWAEVATAAGSGLAGAMAGGAANDGMGYDSRRGFDFGKSLVSGTAAGIASGATAAVMRGGRVQIVQVASDAFGNALGNSLVASASSTNSSQEEVLGQQIAELQGSPSWNALDIPSAFGGLVDPLYGTSLGIDATYAERTSVFDAQSSLMSDGTALYGVYGQPVPQPSYGDGTRTSGIFLGSESGDQSAAGAAATLNGLQYALESGEPQLVKTAQAGGHFYLPALIASAAGIADERLSRIIAFSQFPDQISALDGFTNGTRNLAEGNDYDPSAAGLLSERALHALNGKTVDENVSFYQKTIAENKDNDAVVGIALHGLVDSIFHSREVDGVYRTYEAPLGHGAHGSDPDYISASQAQATTGLIISAFETISGNELSDEQRASVYNALNTALSRASARTSEETDQFNSMSDLYGRNSAGSIAAPNERMELNFRDVVREMVPNLPGVKLEDLPSPFFRGPITQQGTIKEGRIFFGNLPADQANALTNQGIDAAARIMERYRKLSDDRAVSHPVQSGDLYDTKVWSLRRAFPWLNQMPVRTPAKEI